jgi:hypothetical protein
MKNYRIAKLTNGEFVRFYPQRKILGLIWINLFAWNEYYDGFSSYEKAKENLCNALRGPMVEYLDVNCEVKND